MRISAMCAGLGGWRSTEGLRSRYHQCTEAGRKALRHTKFEGLEEHYPVPCASPKRLRSAAGSERHDALFGLLLAYSVYFGEGHAILGSLNDQPNLASSMGSFRMAFPTSVGVHDKGHYSMAMRERLCDEAVDYFETGSPREEALQRFFLTLLFLFVDDLEGKREQISTSPILPRLLSHYGFTKADLERALDGALASALEAQRQALDHEPGNASAAFLYSSFSPSANSQQQLTCKLSSGSKPPLSAFHAFANEAGRAMTLCSSADCWRGEKPLVHATINDLNHGDWRRVKAARVHYRLRPWPTLKSQATHEERQLGADICALIQAQERRLETTDPLQDILSDLVVGLFLRLATPGAVKQDAASGRISDDLSALFRMLGVESGEKTKGAIMRDEVIKGSLPAARGRSGAVTSQPVSTKSIA